MITLNPFVVRLVLTVNFLLITDIRSNNCSSFLSSHISSILMFIQHKKKSANKLWPAEAPRAHPPPPRQMRHREPPRAPRRAHPPQPRPMRRRELPCKLVAPPPSRARPYHHGRHRRLLRPMRRATVAHATIEPRACRRAKPPPCHASATVPSPRSARPTRRRARCHRSTPDAPPAHTRDACR